MFVVQLSIWIQTNYYSDLGHSYIFHREYLIQLKLYNHFSDITRKDHVLWPPSICPTQYLFGRMEAKDEAGGGGGQISNRDRPRKQG